MAPAGPWELAFCFGVGRRDFFFFARTVSANFFFVFFVCVCVCVFFAFFVAVFLRFFVVISRFLGVISRFWWGVFALLHAAIISRAARIFGGLFPPAGP